MNPQDTDPLRAQGTDREPYPGWTLDPVRMTPAGTRVTWFGLGWCVGVLSLALFVIATPSEAPEPPSTAPTLRGAPLRASEGPLGTGSLPSLDSQGAALGAALEEAGTTSPAERMGLITSLDLATGLSGQLGGVPLSAKVGSALYSGTATWCAPTPKYCQSWGGDAMLGAVNSFRWGDEPYRVRVRRDDRSAVVTVVSFCACRNRADAIDLSPAAFSKLAELPLGRIPVEVEVLGD